MAALAITTPTLLGAATSYTSANAGGDTIAAVAGARYLLHFKNSGGAPIQPIIDDPNSQGPSGNTAFNPDVTLTAVPLTNGDRVSIIDASRFINPSTGVINVTYSATPTGVTVGVFGPL